MFEVESGETTPWLYFLVEQPFGEISGTVGYEDNGLQCLRDARVEPWSGGSAALEFIATERDELPRRAGLGASGMVLLGGSPSLLTNVEKESSAPNLVTVDLAQSSALSARIGS